MISPHPGEVGDNVNPILPRGEAMLEKAGAPQSHTTELGFKAGLKTPGSLNWAILPPATENYPNLEVRQEEDSKSSQCGQEAHSRLRRCVFPLTCYYLLRSNLITGDLGP